MRSRAFSYYLALLFLISPGCSMAMECYYEQDQVNYQELSHNGSCQSKPLSPVLVEAEVIKEDVYKGGDSSFDTWPHRRYILKVKNGHLPTNNRASKFEYHTAHLDSFINVGDVLVFVFSSEGILYDVRKSNQESTKASENRD